MTTQISPEQWHDYILFQFDGLIKTLKISHHEDLSKVIQYIAQEFQTADDDATPPNQLADNSK